MQQNRKKLLNKKTNKKICIVAGGSVRTLFEAAGVQNICAKQLGSNNLLNNARAAISALQSLKTAN